eukprot:TRINITY_DN243_c0_g2_i6.p1 TRINITY_DN243_c0_g2~~TRINITY_DN243_c0_g2_i6.p1  ORF type:complete len:2426 (+),score=729.35 TRINITY_DN243_c0_g2_i6:57-7280(+)
MRTVAALAAISAASAQPRTDHFHTDANGEIADLLSEINKAREVVGSCPLVWDENLATAAGQQDNIVRCEGNPNWQTQDKDGLLVQSAYIVGDPVTPAKWLEYPISHKSHWDALTTTPTVADQAWFRWTSIVWKDVTKMGCHSCHYVNEFYNDFITFCKFDAVTNVDNQFDTKVGKDGETCDKCSTVDCTHLEDQCVEAACDSNTVTCVVNNKADGTECVDSSPNVIAGTSFCVNGVCKGKTPCTDVTCTSPHPCYMPGVCEPATGVCSDPWLLEMLVCDDGNPNTVDDRCLPGDPPCRGTDRCDGVVCQDAVTCRAASTCDSTTGTCVEGEVLADGASCDDGNAITQNDVCTAGVCKGEYLCTSCTGKDACHKDGLCSPLTGECSVVPQDDGHPCDDGNLATDNDVCTGGVCAGTNSCDGVVCTPSSACVSSTCSLGVCIENPLASGDVNQQQIPCNDGNSSTVDDICVNGKCVGTNLCDPSKDCQPENSCFHSARCDPKTGNCVADYAGDLAPCDDGDALTVNDQCENRTCVGVNLCANVNCPAIGDCELPGQCDPATGHCTKNFKPNDTACTDGMLAAGKCQGGVCEVTVPCTCLAPACQVCDDNCAVSNAPNGLSCDDGNDATVEDTCNNGQCVGVDKCNGVQCPLPSDCFTNGRCDKNTGMCEFDQKPTGSACDDGNPLTVQDKCCDMGCCEGVDLCKDVNCDVAIDDCHTTGVCDINTGTCTTPMKPDNTTCDDGDVTTVDDVCNMGTCIGVDRCSKVTCQSKSGCHDAGVCDPMTGLCSDPIQADGTPCDDGSDLTVDDSCQMGKCVGIDKCANVDCSLNVTSCTTASCDHQTGLCDVVNKPDGTQCDDSMVRTINDQCTGGVCTGTDLCKGVTCAPANQCHAYGTCDVMTGKCVDKILVDEPCDDGNLTTANDTCNANAECVGTPMCPADCAPKGDCHEDGVCDPVNALPEDGGICYYPRKKDGVVCDDGNPLTVADQCRSGTCEGTDCGIEVLRKYGCHGKCQFVANGDTPPAGGHYGWTPDGNMYVENGCRGQFRIQATGEIVMCYRQSLRHQVCKLRNRVNQCAPPPKPDLCAGVVCTALDDCHEAGCCNPDTGLCSNPTAPDGTQCDDGDAATVDKCNNGVCIGTVPQCYRASKWYPDRECKYDPKACNWGSNTWGTMEECCRPGNAHKDGCYKAPEEPKECWRASKWWPNTECKLDMNACDWGMGTKVWESKEECCKPGNAHDCGCVDPDPPVCWKPIAGKNMCEEVPNCTGNGKDSFSTEKECCKSTPGKCQNACKALDVVFILDGSGSMKQDYRNGGRKYLHGYYAMVDMIKDWLADDTFPLTGEFAGMPQTNTNGGVRLGFVQFSGKNPYRGRGGKSEAKTTPKGYATGGKLSGDKGQLEKDLDWHRKKFYSGGTMIEKAFDIASNMFEQEKRSRAIVVITDGAIYDGDKLAASRKKLDKYDVVVFGVVVRKYTRHTKADLDAEKKLKPVLSKPESDHFYNVLLADADNSGGIDSLHQVLVDMCDPSSVWGSCIRPATVPVDKLPPVPVKPPAATGGLDFYRKDEELKPFHDLVCSDIVDPSAPECGCDSEVHGLSVSIEGGYDDKRDTMTCHDCQSLGIKFEFKVSTGMITLSNNKKFSEYVEALASIAFSTTSDKCDDRTFTYSFGAGFSVSNADNHAYRFYDERGLRWDEAAKKCSEQIEMGRRGYLITVTSEKEQNIASDRLGGSGWMGASDAGIEGDWRWVTGPEGGCTNGLCDLGVSNWVNDPKGTASNNKQGELFYEQATKKSIGYTHWVDGEPNDYKKRCGAGSCYKNGEDFGHFYSHGGWNDYPIDGGVDGYICEWGGMPNEKTCDNAIASRTFRCQKDGDGRQCVPSTKPKPALGKNGCPSGWISQDLSVDVEWCNKNCLVTSRGGEPVKLKDECDGRGIQKCLCQPDHVKQCRCKSPVLGAYCSSKTADAAGLHECTAASAEMDGVFDETQPDYQGVPPVANADADSSFVCHNIDNGLWFEVGIGQCRDASNTYFARYTKENVDDLNACKTLCKDTFTCHAIHFNARTKTCSLNGPPVGVCGADSVLCAAPNTKPTGAGTKSGCTKYTRGAKPTDKVTCSSKIDDEIVCMRPNKDGTCPDSSKRSGGGTTQTIKISMGSMSMEDIQKAIAAAMGVSISSVSITHMCAATVTCNGQCTKADLQASGCQFGPDVFKTTSRGAHVLQGEEVVISFEPVGLDDQQTAAAETSLARTVQMAQSPIPTTTDGVPSSLGVIREIGITELGTQPYVTEDTFDIASNVPTPTSPNGEPITQIPGAADSDDDDGSLLWLLIVGIVGACLMVGGFAYIHMKKRKESVNWNDIVVQRERTADASMTGPVSYNKMGEGKGVELDEMQPLQILSDSKNEEVNDLVDDSPNDQPLL